MATVADVLSFVEKVAPSYMKEDWDRVGLNCGSTRQEVKKILVALDPFENVCQEAKDCGADLLQRVISVCDHFRRMEDADIIQVGADSEAAVALECSADIIAIIACDSGYRFQRDIVHIVLVDILDGHSGGRGKTCRVQKFAGLLFFF